MCGKTILDIFMSTTVIVGFIPLIFTASKNPGFLFIKSYYLRNMSENPRASFQVKTCPSRRDKYDPFFFRYTLGNVTVDMCSGEIVVNKVRSFRASKMASYNSTSSMFCFPFLLKLNKIIFLFLLLKSSQVIAAEVACGFAVAMLFVLCNPWTGRPNQKTGAPPPAYSGIVLVRLWNSGLNSGLLPRLAPHCPPSLP